MAFSLCANLAGALPNFSQETWGSCWEEALGLISYALLVDNLEVDVDINLNRDRLPIFCGGFEAVLRDCVECALIEIVSSGADDVYLGWTAFAINDEADEHAAARSWSACISAWICGIYRLFENRGKHTTSDSPRSVRILR